MSKNKVSTETEERLRPLYDHLIHKVKARCLWSAREEYPNDRRQGVLVECWLTPSGHTYLVRVWLDGSGWDVYGEVDKTNSVEETLKKIV